MIAIKTTVALLLLPLLNAADFAQLWSNVNTLTPASAWATAGQQNAEAWGVESQFPGSDDPKLWGRAEPQGEDPKAWGRAEPQGDDPKAWGQETSLLAEEQQPNEWDVTRKSFPANRDAEEYQDYLQFKDFLRMKVSQDTTY